MNAKELRQAIMLSMKWAQKDSKAPDLPADLRGREAAARKAEADRDRLRCFAAVLAGMVQEKNPQLSAALADFLKAEPGNPVSPLQPPAPSPPAPGEPHAGL